MGTFISAFTEKLSNFQDFKLKTRLNFTFQHENSEIPLKPLRKVLKKRNWLLYPPLDFCSFNYFFVGTDVRIWDHEIIPWTFLVLEKKSIL